MIQWFIDLPLPSQAAWWTWGAMLLALAVAFFRSERGVFLDPKRPWQSFLVVFPVAFAVFLACGGVLLTVTSGFEFAAELSSSVG